MVGASEDDESLLLSGRYGGLSVVLDLHYSTVCGLKTNSPI